MNKITIHGRITKDIELKTTSNGVEYCSLSVAVDERQGKDKEKRTDFFDCTAWRGAAVAIEKFFHKGDGIILTGKMHNDPYEDKETGKKRSSWRLIVEDFEFPIGKKTSSSVAEDYVSVSAEGFTEEADDGELPF